MSRRIHRVKPKISSRWKRNWNWNFSFAFGVSPIVWVSCRSWGASLISLLSRCPVSVSVLRIAGNCLRNPLQAAELESGSLGSTRHMWQHSTSSLLADSGSCNRPTTAQAATDSNVADAQPKESHDAAAAAAATPAVTLGNYVYQCAAKREQPSPSNPSNKTITRHLAAAPKTQPWHQQMTVPAIVLELARSWRRP